MAEHEEVAVGVADEAGVVEIGEEEAAAAVVPLDDKGTEGAEGEKSVEAVETIDLGEEGAGGAPPPRADSSAAPPWQPDEEVTECNRCRSAFGLLTRRHHCRACGLIFCNACCNEQRLLPPAYKVPGLQRVCIGCAETNQYWPLRTASATTSKGRVEYVGLGSGERVVVALPGTSGTCNQALLFVRMLWQGDNGDVVPSGGDAAQAAADGGISCGPFRIIAVSRPGYGDTPLESGPSFEEQVELVHALLETLEISSRLTLVGFGTGAAVAVHFAAAYPDRVDALALLSPIAKEFWPGQARGQPKEKAGVGLVPSLFTSSLQGISKWGARSAPSTAMCHLFSHTSVWEEDMQFMRAYDVEHCPIKSWLFHAFLLSIMTDSGSKAGIDNDHKQLAELAALPFDKVQARTLVVAGKDDAIVDASHAEHAAEQIEGATLDVRELTDHSLVLGKFGAEVQEELGRFITE
eukprot:TRINITY_DN20792_c0_g1_i1.p1 TRINITY_DN20792_c0_g1~~TRINITY_DN20792_c0_g1_i1.p1  ORF type:complete len:477 (-),score=180.96 TRINITY_DN20792_c0_g1_i1:393-1784(-)